MARIEGGCLCGAVRYRSDAEPAMQVVCHCKACQKNSGATYSLNVAIPVDALKVEGEALARYEDHSGASGKPFFRYFCRNCGSPIYGSGEAYGPLAFIKAGTLDDAGWVAPETHIWCSEKLAWTPVPDGATMIERNPG